jgi:hypothetical protein
MRMQDSQAGCGPASMSNALEAMGIVRSQAECEALCGTTGTAGTSPRALLRAIRSVEGLVPVVVDEKRKDVAILRLFAALDYGQAVIMAVDATLADPEGSHWVAAVGLLGPRVLIADPAETYLVTSLSKEALLDRWACKGRKPFYAIILAEDEIEENS